MARTRAPTNQTPIKQKKQQPKKPPPAPRRNPLTTQAKIARAKAQAAKSKKNTPREAPSHAPVSLPPPGEMTELEDAKEARKKAAKMGAKIKAGVWNWGSRRGAHALTTQEKIEKMREKRDREFETKEMWEGATFKKAKGKKREQGGFTVRVVSLRVQRERKLMKKMKEQDVVVLGLNEGLKPKEEKVFDWMGLPTEVQKRIIRYTVVDQKCLVWPENLWGREQPDLSMVSRDLRQQVLEIYYQENTFGISLDLKGMQAVQKWATMLDERWFRLIRNWCFEYEDPNSGALIRKVDDQDRKREDKSFVVSVRCQEREDGRSMLSSGPSVAIHRAAACIMPGTEEFAQCVVRQTPMQLNGMILAALDEKGKLRASEIRELVKALRGMVDEVGESKCVHNVWGKLCAVV